ncbi:hypothetical protein EDC04DRAFT_2902762 [Pisolithus marmoratus]|nr:hypothetical protein EDC04DRAFT_2902762 [Pisolithus marmoratus]
MVAPSTTANPSSLEHVLAEIQKELQELHTKFYNYVSTHEACCVKCGSQSSSEASLEDGQEDQSDCPPPPFQYYVPSVDGTSVEDTNPPSWLRSALSHPDTPLSFQSEIHTPDPISFNPLPSGALNAIKLIFDGTPPFYLGIYRDRSLALATNAPRGMVSTSFRFPPDPSTPRANH